MVILGIVLLLVGYLVFRHPVIVGLGWLLVVLGIVLLVVPVPALHGGFY